MKMVKGQNNTTFDQVKKNDAPVLILYAGVSGEWSLRKDKKKIVFIGWERNNGVERDTHLSVKI